MKCAKCQLYREESSLPRNLIFPKFRRQGPSKDQSLEIFKRILIYIPIIDGSSGGGGGGSSLDEILNYEEKVEGQKKSPDYEKL
jgi:hypothetical protein